jgi:uroporphyrinogen-III decarboxylase
VTSKQRLLEAININEPDRVPIVCHGLVGWDEQCWYNSKSSYKSLMDLIREKTDCLHMASLPPPAFGNAADAVRGVESASKKSSENIIVNARREGKALFIETIYHTPKGNLKSLHRVNDDVCTVWTLEHTLKTIDDIDKFISLDWQQADQLDLSDFAQKQQDLGDKGIMMPSISDPIAELGELFEMSEFLILAFTETKKIKRAMDFIHEFQIAHLKALLQAGLKASVDWSQCLFRICGPEYATEPYLPPDYFALLVTPYVKRMSEVIHQYGAKVRFHCHGRVRAVLDEIMKTQPDALDPVEPPPDGDIELGEVKKRIGDRVCLFGNIEISLLENGQAEQVRDFVIDSLNQAKAGGGFVCMPTGAPLNDPLSPNTEENYRIFIETALEYGKY